MIAALEALRRHAALVAAGVVLAWLAWELRQARDRVDGLSSAMEATSKRLATVEDEAQQRREREATQAIGRAVQREQRIRSQPATVERATESADRMADWDARYRDVERQGRGWVVRRDR
jgi:hypothetical protein